MLDVTKPSGEAETQPVSSSEAPAVPTTVCAARSVSPTRSKPTSVLCIAPGTVSNTVDFYWSAGQPQVRGAGTHEQECRRQGPLAVIQEAAYQQGPGGEILSGAT